MTENALLEKVSLSRRTDGETEISLLDFGRFMENRYLADNAPLQGGDVIIVPKAERGGVIVLGEVQAPGGYYKFGPDSGLLDAIMLAGGFTENAQEDRVSLTRQTDRGGAEIVMIDFTALVDKRYLEDDAALQDGDLIIVPKAIAVCLF